MSVQSRIGVLIVDDHHLVRTGIATLINSELDMEVIGEASCGSEAVDAAGALQPEVVLMDISMPGMDGFEATEKIHASNPGIRVLVLTQYEHEEYVKRMVQVGASGYILKNSLLDDLRKAIRVVAGGDCFYAPSISRFMIDSYVRDVTGQSMQKPIFLTNRETQILQLIAEGLTTGEISQRLGISPRTVEFHRANLTEKVGVRDTVGLVKYAIQKKIVRIPVSE